MFSNDFSVFFKVTGFECALLKHNNVKKKIHLLQINNIKSFNNLT